MADGPGRDFFISYAGADRTLAEWIASELEAAGYSTVLQHWDFRPGTDFVHEMQVATETSARTIAVLSPAYFASAFGEAEWRVAFAKDPSGEKGLLIPVRVQLCELPGFLITRVYVDLVGVDETTARKKLLAAVDTARPRPTSRPYPGMGSTAGTEGGLSLRWEMSRPYDLLIAPGGLVGRSNHLGTLTSFVAGNAPEDRVLVVRAMGGMGKSALVWHFLRQVLPTLDGGQRPEVVVWWSFADVDDTLTDLLQRLAVLAPVGIVDGLVERAIAGLRNHRLLLVLDGLERHLEAFTSMPDRPDLDAVRPVRRDLGEARRRISSPRLAEVLKAVLGDGRSQVIATSRLMPSDLEAAADRPRYGARVLDLPPLTVDEGRRLLLALGVPAHPGLMGPVAESTGLHPLLLQAVARGLAASRLAPADLVANILESGIRDDVLERMAEVQGASFGLLLRQLSADELLVAQVVAAAMGPQTAVQVKDAADRLSRRRIDVVGTLGTLLDLGFVARQDPPLGSATWSMHPVVRAAVRTSHTAETLTTVTQAIAVDLADTFAHPATDVHGLSDLQRPIALFHALCDLGRMDEAAAHYLATLHHPMTFTCREDHQERLVVLSRLFPDGWSAEPAVVNRRLRGGVLNAAALTFQWLGSNTRAARLIVSALEGGDDPTLWSNLASILMYTDDAEGACRAAVQAVRHGWGRSDVRIPMMYLALILHQCGFPTARVRRQLARLGPDNTASAWLDLRRGDLALWDGDVVSALAFGQRSLETAAAVARPFEAALIEGQRLIGQALVRAGRSSEAVPHLEDALARTRNFVLVQEELPVRIALARALIGDDPERAESLITDGFQHRRPEEYRWFSVDAHVVLHDLCHGLGDPQRAQEHRRRAVEIAGNPAGWGYAHGFRPPEAALPGAETRPLPDDVERLLDDTRPHDEPSNS